jgi:hypothetical protein
MDFAFYMLWITDNALYTIAYGLCELQCCQEVPVVEWLHDWMIKMHGNYKLFFWFMPGFLVNLVKVE